MANAVIMRGNPEPPPIKSVALHLTLEEARYIKALVGAVGGTGRNDSPIEIWDTTKSEFKYGFRALNDAIYTALGEI